MTAAEWRAEADLVVAAAENALRGSRRRAGEASSRLSPREDEVLGLLAANKTDREIAQTLFISRRTVNAHVASILGKLRVHSRQEAVARAREWRCWRSRPTLLGIPNQRPTMRGRRSGTPYRCGGAARPRMRPALIRATALVVPREGKPPCAGSCSSASRQSCSRWRRLCRGGAAHAGGAGARHPRHGERRNRAPLLRRRQRGHRHGRSGAAARGGRTALRRCRSVAWRGAGRRGWRRTCGLHAAEPGMRLEVEEVIAAGDRVMARVGVRNGPDAAALDGAVVDRSPPWSAVESFRVAGGQIVERRGGGDELAVVRPVAEAALAFVAPRRASSRSSASPSILARVGTWSPRGRACSCSKQECSGSIGTVARARTAAPSRFPRVVVVVAAEGRDGATNLGGGGRGSGRDLRGSGVALRPLPDDAYPSGVTAQTLAGGEATEIGVGPATAALARATLARDARLTLSSAAGPVLAAIADGEADMTAWGTAWVRRGEDGMGAFTREATLAAGEGLLLEPGGLAGSTARARGRRRRWY